MPSPSPYAIGPGTAPGARPGAERASGPAGHRRDRAKFQPADPLDAVAAGSVASLEVGPFDRSFDFVLSRLGDPDGIRRGGRVGGFRSAWASLARRAGVYLVRVRAGEQRAVWPLAVVGGLPQKESAEGRQPGAGGAACPHLAGAQPRGRRCRRLRGHPGRLGLGTTRPFVRRRRAARRLPTGGGPAPALAPIASGWPTTSPPTSRWPGGGPPSAAPRRGLPRQ